MATHPTPARPAHTKGGSTGAELLDAVVRLNRWVSHHTAWPLPPAQARVLSQIDGLGSARVSDLARMEHCSQPTMTTQVHRLQQQGFVTRTPSREDARVNWISLTDQGRHVLAQARNARTAILESLITQLGEDDRQGLQDAVLALSRLLAVAYRQTTSSQES
ncbi:DNA-binding MarR family transcriptional regulator OS=Castellaniella defragrans OX=75697 GN=HNR28_000380 PE=4 SV=1 [Castellaniella defragrans]